MQIMSRETREIFMKIDLRLFIDLRLPQPIYVICDVIGDQP